MSQRKKKRIKALFVGAFIVAGALIIVYVFGNFVIPWIISLHGL